MSTSTLAQSYDQVPFPSYPLPQTHPDWLAVVATLFGLQPAPIAGARVLELGCASGANLIPMAERHPESSFLGVDFSQGQIATARAIVERLGLTNIELQQMSVMDIDASFGRFDYVIAHGFYSWVPHEVREKVLAICRTSLAPRGIGYISYNLYPGWHLRGICRELMCSATPSSAPPLHRAAEARKRLDFLVAALGAGSAAYDRVLRDDMQRMLEQPDNYLLHDFFEEENHPVYFHEFVERAASHGLQYLGDAALGTMFASNFGPVLERRLAEIATDSISLEQHLDLLRNRAFRRTLLCHQEVQIQRVVDARRLASLYVVAQVRPKGSPPELTSQRIDQFETPQGVVVSTPTPLLKAALLHLGRVWPRAVSFNELTVAAGALIAAETRAGEPSVVSDEGRDALAENLLECAAMSAVTLRSDADRFVTRISDKPCVSPLVRLQAQSALHATNRRHESIGLDPVLLKLLQSLDGLHDRQALLGELIAAADRGELSIRVNDASRSGSSQSALLAEVLDRILTTLADSCMLIA